MVQLELDEQAMDRILRGGVESLSALPGYVIRVRLVNERVVLDRITEEVYNKRHGQSGVGGSATPTLDNP